MAVWGIDIGHTALKAVKLNRTKEGLEIDQVAYIPMELGESEEDRPEQVRTAVKTFLSRHPIRNERIIVSLPGLHAFSRFIKLPPVEAKKVGEMVMYEAQQQIPFPIDEVMWGHHMIDREYEPGEEIEVGIFAARKELLLGFLSELRENGVSPDYVTIAPLAIYNFVTYNANVDETTVILDIGAKHTDLIVVKGANFWIRNLRIAGGDITEALSARFKIPTHEAEKLKRQGSNSKNADKIFKSIESVLKDFTGEVHRSISFFKSQAGDLKPKKMLLLGDGAKLKNIRGFFEKELGFKVQKFTKLEQDKFVVGESVDFDVLKKHILSFGVALGLGVQGVGMSTTNLNLLPTEDRIVGELKRKVPMAAATAVLCWIAVGFSYVYWTGKVAALNETIKKSSGVSKLLAEDTAAKAAMNTVAVEKLADGFRKRLDNRLLPLEIINRLRDILPQQNAVIPELSEEDRVKPTPNQIVLLQEQRKKLIGNKFWILDFNLNPVEESIKVDDKRANDIKHKGFKISLTVARLWPEGTDRTKVYNQVRSDVVDKILKRFADGPYWVRKPEKARVEGSKPEARLESGEEIYAPDKDATSRDGGLEDFRCLKFPISFEIGFPLKKKPAAPAPK
jgi:type IV pilus assembly protein PilM